MASCKNDFLCTLITVTSSILLTCFWRKWIRSLTSIRSLTAISKHCLPGTMSRQHIRHTRETLIQTNKRPVDSHSEKKVTKSNVDSCIRQILERISCNIHAQLKRYCTRQMNTTFGASSMARTKTLQNNTEQPETLRNTPDTPETT